MTPAAARENDPWTMPDRWRFDLGFGIFAASEPGEGLLGVAQIERPLWFSRRAGDFIQAAVKVRGTVGIGDGFSLHGRVDIGLGAEAFFGRYWSFELIRLGPWAGLALTPEGGNALAGLAITGGWGLHPFRDPRDAIRLSISMFIPMVASNEAGFADDCPTCPEMTITLGYESTF